MKNSLDKIVRVGQIFVATAFLLISSCGGGYSQIALALVSASQPNDTTISDDESLSSDTTIVSETTNSNNHQNQTEEDDENQLPLKSVLGELGLKNNLESTNLATEPAKTDTKTMETNTKVTNYANDVADSDLPTAVEETTCEGTIDTAEELSACLQDTPGNGQPLTLSTSLEVSNNITLQSGNYVLDLNGNNITYTGYSSSQSFLFNIDNTISEPKVTGFALKNSSSNQESALIASKTYPTKK